MKKNSNFTFHLFIMIFMMAISSCSAITYRVGTNKIVHCDRLYSHFGVILRNSDEITPAEIYAAEMIHFKDEATYSGENLSLTIAKHRSLYRQYYKKVLDGKKIVFINYINGKYLDGKLLPDDQPVTILAEPDPCGKKIIWTCAYVNLSENRECTISESNRYAICFWNKLEDTDK